MACWKTRRNRNFLMSWSSTTGCPGKASTPRRAMRIMAPSLRRAARSLAVWLLATVCLSASANADAPLEWQQLNRAEQRVLQHHAADWDSLPNQKRHKLHRSAQRWLAMSPEQKRNARQRFKRWLALPVDQRRHIRQRYQQFKQLQPDEQQRLRDIYAQFKDLPAAQRQSLRERWRQLTPEQRRKIKQRVRRQHRQQADQQ
ncbi:DUF3106 domain-containing protein [Exilibacterium tricleocarpae]|uniref:DUF3106 domain-containing protein n=2 Tax=Exilibacterium tricleocarpae TaxID=2591008 RepID=A0A545U9Y4_9GAMM|nr:DUF3106 domain-containing protein [Exilibacterium tricleocarpae]